MYNKTTVRALYTSAMALLVVAALFWGNCFSCPQVLLSADQHGCCHRTKVPKPDCKTQGLKNFVKAEKAAPVSLMPVEVATVAPPVALEVAPVAVRPASLEITPSFAVPLRI